MSKKDIAFNYPSKVIFGEGKAKELPDRISKLSAKLRVFLRRQELSLFYLME